jgi:S-(hydroxymethyl)glutathione dehydrogenase/alcohol dehydrogenase
LVKVEYSGICGKQIEEISGKMGPGPFLPHLLGHEGFGEVIECGPGIKTVKPTEKVVMHWKKGTGIDSETPFYKWRNNKVNAGWITTFNEQAVVSENRLTAIPDDFDMRMAPLFGCAVTTAFGVVNNDASIKVGQSLIVFGLGGVGLNIIQAASMVSAHPIIGVDVKDNKIEMAKKFGLDYGINALNTEVKDEVNKILEDKCADVVIETTGNSRVIETAYELTKPDGKTILVGVPKKGDNISIYSLPLHFKKVLTGSEGGSSVPDQDIPRLIKLMQANKMTLDGLVTHEFPLEEINQAIELFRSGDAGRILLSMTS